MTPTLLIIGGGIAGLSVGCYGRMNGFRTRVFEMHSLPGGLCTAWRRKGYLVDGCIHWLCGSGPGMSLHRIWQELGPARDIHYVDHEALLSLELPEMTFTLYADPDKLEEYLVELGPEDEAVIHELTQAIRDFVSYEAMMNASWLPPQSADPLRWEQFGSLMQVWNTTTMGYFMDRLRSPKLKKVFEMLYGPWMPLFLFLLPLGYASRQSSGYPVGGSLEFARSIERRYLSLGGEIEYQAKVNRILVEDGRAVGLLLEDGREIHGEDVTVISAADLHATMFDMLEGRYLTDASRAWFEHVPVIGSPLQVTVGVNMSVAETPSAISGILCAPPSPIVLGGKALTQFNLQVFNYDPTAAPQGKSVIRVNLSGDYNYWKQLRQTPEQYDAEKERIAREVVAALDGRYPGLAGRVEMIDVATPLSFERYTGNWQGSSQGWIPTPEAANGTAWFSSKTLPGLERFYLAGQWVEMIGGVPSAALSARAVLQMICNRDGQQFVAEIE
jgi:phytoene dehydrogenase-like protein